MPRRKSQLTLFFSLLAIFVANTAALVAGWYRIYPWYDIPMHMAGGAWIAYALVYLAEERYPALQNHKWTFFAIGFVAVAVLWEVFEYSLDIFLVGKYTITTIPWSVIRDTLGDLVNDTLGASVVWYARYSGKRIAASAPSRT